ncbi:MAG: hypothetical protein K9K38_21730, partial [Rhodoferax sp.]|nr:hypothetical protein [Rhodoferax sp.]
MSLTRTIEFGTIDRSATSDALIPATLATSAGVDRYGVLEVLDCTTTGVDLSRAPLPLIVAHDNSKLSIGLVEQVQARGDKITGMVRFSTSPEAQQIRADVVAGIHRSLSVGYKLLDAGTPIDRGFLYRWQPHEVSIVPIPADPQSGFFRSQPSINTMTQTTTQPTPATQTREADILALCKRHSVPELANGLISEGATIEAARSAILNELATRD